MLRLIPASRLALLLGLLAVLPSVSAVPTPSVATTSSPTTTAPSREPTVAPSFPLTNYTCLGTTETYLFESDIGRDFHFSGAALGGLFVLEPWITPSLFYQFLGPTQRFGKDAPNHVGMDAHTFCEALGQAEANRQLRVHWATWATEEHIKKLAEVGADHLRIPVPDWMFIPYEPFVECWAGSLEALERVIQWCGQYGMNRELTFQDLSTSHS